MEPTIDSKELKNNQFPCSKCGASLVFAPGTQSLSCPYCGEKNEIQVEAVEIIEEDFEAIELDVMSNDTLTSEVSQVKCATCGAISSLPANTVSSDCAFCGTALVVSQSEVKRMIKPKYVLPFAIAKNKSLELYKSWIGGHFWAPNALKEQASQGKLQGLYIPYWTYDCQTSTQYTGERGESRTETYEENGQKKTRSYTEWHYASGTVSRFFDDILINASKSLPEDLKNSLSNWNLGELKPYNEQYLTGFTTEIYQIGLSESHEFAKTIMIEKINSDIRSDIGGNEQRIHSANTEYSNSTFKHILLPIWLTSYKFNGKTYSILINGQSGEIKGNYPVSTLKVITAILIGIGVIAGIYLLLKK